MGKFAKEMSEWVIEVVGAIKEDAEKVSKEIIQGVISLSPHPSGAEGRQSPYSTGEFVNNWKVGANIVPEFIDSPIESKQQKVSELSKAISGWFDSHVSLYIWNSGPYVAQVEYEGWKYSDKYAPVRRTLDSIKTKG